jgi:5-methylcytosine-specific restriction enzyme subunit McrC
VTVEVHTQVVVIPCEEYGEVSVDPSLLLGPDGRLNINEDVRKKDAYRVNFAKGEIKFTASSFVGVIPLNEHVVLKVSPRVPIANLTRMVQETGHPVHPLRAFREYRGHGTADDWVMDLYAETLIRYVGEVLDQGLYRQYTTRQGEGSYPRGRINFPKTLSRFASHGIPNKAAFEWHERTLDIPANQTLKAALERVHTHLTRGVPQKGYGTMLAELTRQLAAFEDIRLNDYPGMPYLTDPEVTGLRPLPEPRFYYRPALDLALQVLTGAGFSLDHLEGEDVRLGSLLIEMNDLFENYVRETVQQTARSRRWPVQVLDQKGAVPLYEEPTEDQAPLGTVMEALGPTLKKRPAATPDIVFQMPNGGPVLLVAELKNTAKGGALPDRDEVN